MWPAEWLAAAVSADVCVYPDLQQTTATASLGNVILISVFPLSLTRVTYSEPVPSCTVHPLTVIRQEKTNLSDPLTDLQLSVICQPTLITLRLKHLFTSDQGLTLSLDITSVTDIFECISFYLAT